jgi:hypothetical protein
VQKEFEDEIRVSPRFNLMTFREHAKGLSADFNHDLLLRYLPRTTGVLHGDRALARSLRGVIPEATQEALEATEFIGVFGRVVRQKGAPHITCLQYLFVWDYQAVPEHECDYEPVFVYVDGADAYMIYDFVHYCSRRLDNSAAKTTAGLRVVPGWHSFLPLDEVAERDDIRRVEPLSDQHLQAWWSIPDEEARLKIEGHLRDPFSMEAPGHFMDAPDENAQTICCTFWEIEKALREFEDPRQAMVEGSKRALAKCVGILALYRLGAYLQLLGEMQDIGMVKMSATGPKGSLDLASIGAMLRNGFISLTKVGGEILKGLFASQDD